MSTVEHSMDDEEDSLSVFDSQAGAENFSFIYESDDPPGIPTPPRSKVPRIRIWAQRHRIRKIAKALPTFQTEFRKDLVVIDRLIAVASVMKVDFVTTEEAIEEKLTRLNATKARVERILSGLDSQLARLLAMQAQMSGHDGKKKQKAKG